MISPADAKTGRHISPVHRLRIMSADEWEEFIEEWIDSLKSKYIQVDKLGGAGDKGRDVIAQVDETGVWDNYQCKHYDHPLRPSDIWAEIGKLIYYTSIGDFECPRKYYFIAPQGIGTKLSTLLKNPESLVTGLIENWDSYCKDKITKSSKISLNAVEKQIRKINFSIFSYIKPLMIIEQHRDTPYFVERFGGGLPKRGTPLAPPTAPIAEESEYIRKIIEAYSDFKKRSYSNIDDIEDSLLIEHYHDSRKQFYSAESLKRFSRDALPEGEFELLQQEFLDGIKDEVRNPMHKDGYARLLEVVKVARTLQITAHALIECMVINDRAGICHQLANNNDTVKWVHNE